MGGANYMGGKRNAMKARAKDQVGRKQKGFFKRQRLDMLTKGLSGSLEPIKSHHEATKVGPGDIELAHARTKQKTVQGESSKASSLIPSPVHVSSTRSRPRKRRRIGHAHTSSSDIGFKSEILDKLDQCEPLFLRKIMDQILATPDLAALSHKSPEAPACQETPKQCKTVTQTRHSATPPKVGSTIGTGVAKETRPPKKRSMTSDTSRSLQVDAITMSPLDDISDWNTCEYDGSVHDSGYGDNFGEDSIASDSDWSIYQHNSCSSARRHDDSGDSCEKALPSEYETESVTGSNTEFSAFEEHNLPVKAAKKSVFIRDDGETIYGRLFEDPDPWRRIGIILGLEKEEVQRGPGDDKTPNLEPKKDSRKNNDSIDENTVMSSIGPESEREDCTSEIAQEVVAATDELDVFNIEYAESTQREAIPEVLAMPQLQEVDGKFLAPSISLGWEFEEE